jgi:hypothetical protein
LAAGRLSPDVFVAAERRRAINRLRQCWKKDPWLPGVTIDLGAHEKAFLTSLAASGWRAAELPPAVLDWARWRFRRLMLDRQQPSRWAAVAEQLRDRVRAAGSPPIEPRTVPAPSVIFRAPERLAAYSRRRVLDAPRQVHKVVKATSNSAHAAEEVPALTDILMQHRRDLAPVLALCETDEDRLRVAAAYKDLLALPGKHGAQQRWRTLLRSLRG